MADDESLVHVGPQGRLVIPARLRQAFHLEVGETLVARRGYVVRSYRVTPDGRCPRCQSAVPGRWSGHV